MSSQKTSRDVGAPLRRRWAFVAVAVVATVAAAVVTVVLAGDIDGVAGIAVAVLVAVLVAALIGLVLGLVAIWVADAVDATIRAPGDFARFTSAPNLAVVRRPHLDGDAPDDVTMFSEPNSIEAEGYRSALTSLEFVLRTPGAAPADAPAGDGAAGGPAPLVGRGRIVLVTSARPGEGKSSLAANLAAAAAMAGRRVVLVDADLRKPQLHRLFRLDNDAGLSSMLTGEVKGFSAVQRLEAVPHLVVLTGGPPPPDPAELLTSPRLGAALASMASQADLLIVDAPPVLAVTDPTLIAQQCDATIVVATGGESSRRELAEALRRLSVVDADVVGTVLFQPDGDNSATTNYHYAPSAQPKNWWTGDTAPEPEPEVVEPEVTPEPQPEPEVEPEPEVVEPEPEVEPEVVVPEPFVPEETVVPEVQREAPPFWVSDVAETHDTPLPAFDPGDDVTSADVFGGDAPLRPAPRTPDPSADSTKAAPVDDSWPQWEVGPRARPDD